MLDKTVAAVKKLISDFKSIDARVQRLEKVKPVARDGRDGKDGVSPDPEAIAKEVLAQIATPRDGRDGKDGRKGDKGDRGPKGEPGRDGKSITDVKLRNNELFVSIDGKERRVGRIELPVLESFTPAAGGSGASNRPSPGTTKEIIVEISEAYDVRNIDDAIIATGTGYPVNLPPTDSAIKRIQITSRNGTVILTTSGSELIDGVSSVNLAAGQSRTLTPISGEWVTG
jgi:hypothetical protein